MANAGMKSDGQAQPPANKEVVLPMSLEGIGGLTRGFASLEAGFFQLTKSLADGDCSQSVLFRDICSLREQFDRIVGRLQPSILFQDDPSIVGTAGSVALDLRG